MVGSGRGWQSQSENSRGQISFSWRLGYNWVGSGLWWDVALGQTGFTWWGVLVEGSFSSLAGSQFFSAEKEFPLLFLLCNLKQFKFVYLICVSEPCWTPRDGHKGLGGHFLPGPGSVLLPFPQQVNGELRGLCLGAHLVVGRAFVHRPSFYEVGLFSCLPLLSLKLIGSISQGWLFRIHHLQLEEEKAGHLNKVSGTKL